MQTGLLEELRRNSNEAIEFKYNHAQDGDVKELLQVVRELVVKPDRLDELLVSLTNAVNMYSGKDKADMDAVGKLAETVSVIKDMDKADVAKVIIREFGKSAGKVKRKKSRSSSAKAE